MRGPHKSVYKVIELVGASSDTRTSGRGVGEASKMISASPKSPLTSPSDIPPSTLLRVESPRVSLPLLRPALVLWGPRALRLRREPARMGSSPLFCLGGGAEPFAVNAEYLE